MINPEDEVCFDLRTSCTEEEAASKMLGWMQGNRRICFMTVTEEGINPEQLPHMLRLPTPLDELIRDERETASVRFYNACARGDVALTEKWEARVMFWDDIANRATRYKLAISQELARPVSKLQIDEFLTADTGVRHITLTSLDQWSRRIFGIAILDQEQNSVAGYAPSSLKRPRTKGLEQENAIVEAIVQLGHDPLKLPSRPPGKSGAKAQVRGRLNPPSPLFPSDKVFDKAWERLKKDGQLIEEGVSPKIDQGGTLAGEDS